MTSADGMLRRMFWTLLAAWAAGAPVVTLPPGAATSQWDEAATLVGLTIDEPAGRPTRVDIVEEHDEWSIHVVVHGAAVVSVPIAAPETEDLREDTLHLAASLYKRFADAPPESPSGTEALEPEVALAAAASPEGAGGVWYRLGVGVSVRRRQRPAPQWSVVGGVPVGPWRFGAGLWLVSPREQLDLPGRPSVADAFLGPVVGYTADLVTVTVGVGATVSGYARPDDPTQVLVSSTVRGSIGGPGLPLTRRSVLRPVLDVSYDLVPTRLWLDDERLGTAPRLAVTVGMLLVQGPPGSTQRGQGAR